MPACPLHAPRCPQMADVTDVMMHRTAPRTSLRRWRNSPGPPLRAWKRWHFWMIFHSKIITYVKRNLNHNFQKKCNTQSHTETHLWFRLRFSICSIFQKIRKTLKLNTETKILPKWRMRAQRSRSESVGRASEANGVHQRFRLHFLFALLSTLIQFSSSSSSCRCAFRFALKPGS